MGWQLFLTGIALFMIFEGMAPFAAPEAWRRAMMQLAALPSHVIRRIGGIIMFAGVLVLLVATRF